MLQEAGRIVNEAKNVFVLAVFSETMAALDWLRNFRAASKLNILLSIKGTSQRCC